MTLIGAGMAQNPVGGTSANGTGKLVVGTVRSATKKASEDATKRVDGDGTKKRQYKARARHCKVCGAEFTPKIKTGRYCSGKCRSKALRQRKARGRSAAAPSVPLVNPITCVFCGVGEFKVAGKGARYCSARCRRAAYKVRREAAVVALATVYRRDVEHVWDRVDQHGLKRAVETLHGAGYVYDDGARAWVKLPTN